MIENPEDLLEIPQNTWCDKHWQLVLDDKHVSGLAATVGLISKVINTEEFARRCGWSPEEGTSADANLIDSQMELICPLCCYIGDKQLGEVLFEATVTQAEA